MGQVMLRAMVVQAAGFALANAKARIHEQGGNNLGDAVEAWQKNTGGAAGESWCQDFQFSMDLKAWCSMKGLLTGKTDVENRAIMLAHAAAFSAETHIARTGSCQKSYDAAKAQGRARGPEFDPLQGDQVYYDMPVHGKKLGHAHHTGKVLRVLPSGEIEAVEGNTSSGVKGSQGDGDGVFVRKRSPDDIYGFAHYE